LTRKKRPKLATRIVDEIRRRIDEKVYAVGSRLPTEVTLVKEFGVSRTVVREAVAALSADGYVEPRQGSGVFVLEPPRLDVATSFRGVLAAGENVLALLELRLAIEIEAAALAASRRTPDQLDRIRAAHGAYGAAVARGVSPARADIDFHVAIAEATENCCFIDAIRILCPLAVLDGRNGEAGVESELGPDLRPFQTTIGEHDAIVEAIAVGDVESARSAMRLHLAGSRRRVSDGAFHLPVLDGAVHVRD